MGNSLLGTPTDTQGVLMSLREQMMAAPEEREAARARRDAAAQKYQDQLNMPLPSVGGMGSAVQEYLQRYAVPGGNLDPARTMVGAIGKAGAREQEQAIGEQERQDKAAGFGYQMAEKDLGEIDSHTKNFIAAFRGSGGVVKQPSPEQLRTVYNNAMNSAAQAAKELDFPDGNSRMEWIRKQGDLAVKNYISQFATQPTGPRGDGSVTPDEPVSPVKPLQQSQQPQPETEEPIAIDKSTVKDDRAYVLLQEYEMEKKNLGNWRSNPESEQYQNALRNMGLIRKELVDHYKMDPKSTSGQNATPGLGASITQPSQSQPTPRDTSPVPQITGVTGAQTPVPVAPYKDKVQEAQKPEAGKALSKERTSMSELFSKNSALVNNLGSMLSIYEKNPNIPEGELGPMIQKFRSGLKSVGIEVDPSTPDAQVFDSLAKKLALSMKSADGQNLLPGAMSNYEDQLLQSMSAGLSGTREGNLKLMRLMAAVAQSNMRLAEAASKHTDKNGLLASDWLSQKERYGKIEMLRLRDQVKQIVGEGN